MDGQIDFTAYSDPELREALETLDGRRYPANYTRIHEEIARRARIAAAGTDGESAALVPSIRILNPTMPIELVDLDELPTRDQFTVFWGFVWRSLVMALATVLVGVVLSVIAAIFMGLLALVSGIEVHWVNTFQKAAGVVAATAIAFALAWHFLRWLLQTKMGRYRLMLGRESSDAG